MFIAVTILTDCVAGFGINHRNKVLRKLLIKGKFPAKVHDGGYIFSATAIKTMLFVSIVGPLGARPLPPLTPTPNASTIINGMNGYPKPVGLVGAANGTRPLDSETVKLFGKQSNVLIIDERHALTCEHDGK